LACKLIWTYKLLDPQPKVNLTYNLFFLSGLINFFITNYTIPNPYSVLPLISLTPPPPPSPPPKTTPSRTLI
jgi:hypothetical protein